MTISQVPAMPRNDMVGSIICLPVNSNNLGENMKNTEVDNTNQLETLESLLSDKEAKLIEGSEKRKPALKLSKESLGTVAVLIRGCTTQPCCGVEETFI
jgi:hypothetical protein